MRLSVGPALGTLLALFGAGCGMEPLSSGLDLRLYVQPAQVSPEDTFTVRLVVRNAGDRDTTLVSGCSVPTFFGLDSPSGVVYPTPGFACLTVITPYKIAAGDSLTMTRRFVATQPPGEYVVFTDWQIGGLPVLRQPLTVQ